MRDGTLDHYVSLITHHASRITFHASRLTPLQNRDRRRIIVRVTQAELEPRAAADFEKLLPAAVQDDEGLARFLAAHLHVLPTQLLANAGAERLGDRLLGGEPRGQK